MFKVDTLRINQGGTAGKSLVPGHMKAYAQGREIFLLHHLLLEELL